MIVKELGLNVTLLQVCSTVCADRAILVLVVHLSACVCVLSTFGHSISK